MTFDISRPDAWENFASWRSPRILASKRFTACVTAESSLAPIHSPENSRRHGSTAQRTSTAKQPSVKCQDVTPFRPPFQTPQGAYQRHGWTRWSAGLPVVEQQKISLFAMLCIVEVCNLSSNWPGHSGSWPIGSIVSLLLRIWRRRCRSAAGWTSCFHGPRRREC